MTKRRGRGRGRGDNGRLLLLVALFDVYTESFYLPHYSYLYHPALFTMMLPSSQ